MYETLMNKSHKGRRDKVELVFNGIKQMLYVDTLVPGQKLICQDLARKLNTSITPVVQALKGLTEANFVQYVPNKGYFVGEITETEAKELFQVREALETYIIPQVIESLDRNKIENLKTIYKEYKKISAPEQLRFRWMKDSRFHLKITEYSGNRVIYHVLEDVLEHIVLRYKPEYLLEGRMREAEREHSNILEALEERNVEKTQALMRDHIRNGLRYLLRSLPMGLLGVEEAEILSKKGELS